MRPDMPPRSANRSAFLRYPRGFKPTRRVNAGRFCDLARPCVLPGRQSSGKRIYVDPWLDNPKCPEGEKQPERADVIAITHAHGDHVGSAVEMSKQFSPEIIALVELKEWLGNNGAN